MQRGGVSSTSTSAVLYDLLLITRSRRPGGNIQTAGLRSEALLPPGFFVCEHAIRSSRSGRSLAVTGSTLRMFGLLNEFCEFRICFRSTSAT